MTQFSTAAVTRRPTSNIYTVLLAIAVVALAVAVGFAAWKNIQMTGQGVAGFHGGGQNPFYIFPTGR